MYRMLLGAVGLLVLKLSAAADLPPGYWDEARAQELLEKTQTVRLAPDLSALSSEEREALRHLFRAGEVMQTLYEASRHPEARSSYAALQSLHAQRADVARTQALLDLYRLYQGPIAITLDNDRTAFLPVRPQVPGRDVYPQDATKAELDRFVQRYPERRLLDERTVVRRTSAASIDADLTTLAKHPVLAFHHREIQSTLEKLQIDEGFYAVPYAIAYADELIAAHDHLMRAASILDSQDAEFARYLRHRARDLIVNDYEAGDASWVTGRFQRLNAQIGAYETYDDALYGSKAFHGMSILLANEKATAELRRALGGLQQIENALPYRSTKQVREDIPVGVYQVIADYGQARGANTATILPNDPLFSRRYGRTVLMRENIMRNEELFAPSLRAWQAAMSTEHAQELIPEGNFQRTLWHEIGHYLGPDRDVKGRALDVALEEYADAVEEMKSDLVSLFALHRLQHPSLRAIQASGIRRTLQNVKPRSDQPYQTMQLIQFNWFLEHGLLEVDATTQKLKVNYAKYSDVVALLLREVLDLQRSGDKQRTAEFFERWTHWSDLHEATAERMRQAQGPRFTLVRYGALGE